MDDQTNKTTSDEQEKRSPLYEATRKVMLAAIGAAAIAQEELDGFLSRLAERGELAERDARNLAEEMKTRRREVIDERRAEFQSRRGTPITREDIDHLSNRVAELARQLEELKASQRRDQS